MIEPSIQDRDLLGRLSYYLDNLESRVREGTGWLIFGTTQQRAARISQFITYRLNEYRPLISYYALPWRDFALNAYMLNLELGHTDEVVRSGDSRVQQEYALANRVTLDTYYQMIDRELLVISGLALGHAYEIVHLQQVVDARLSRHQPTILIAPRRLDQLVEDVRNVGAEKHWQQIFARMYETSLIAV
ncbi:MAG: hypothetical protein HY331_14875 [Chloroflexi bacterium]|nr:hypothetical protein [Chloroflexota bacterium]